MDKELIAIIIPVNIVEEYKYITQILNIFKHSNNWCEYGDISHIPLILIKNIKEFPYIVIDEKSRYHNFNTIENKRDKSAAILSFYKRKEIENLFMMSIRMKVANGRI